MSKSLLVSSLILSGLLVSCGGGSGDSPISSDQPFNPPNVSSNLVSLSGSTEEAEETESKNDQDSDNNEQEIVVNVQQEEEESGEEPQQQKIVVNVQPPEESNDNSEEEEEEETESDNNNNEETPQQLTIIEEPEPIFIPKEKEKPRYAASTSCSGTCTTGTLHSYSYWLDVPNTPGASIISQNTKFASTGRNGSNYNFPDGSVAIRARYYKANGFTAKYSYEGNSGTFTSDTDLLFSFPKNGQPTIKGILGHNLNLESTKYGTYNFGNIYFDATVDTNTGTFNSQNVQFSRLTNGILHVNLTDNNGNPIHPKRGVVSGLNVNYKPSILSHNSFKPISGVVHGTSSVRGSFSNDGTTGNNKAALPGQLAGEIEIKDFKLIGGESGNRLVGVFVGDKR